MSQKHYPVRIAHVAHGIRAQSQRLSGRSAWWARRWLAVLEAMRLGARFGRARQYAQAGQVVELVREGTHIDAVVAGSRPQPYRVSLDFTHVGERSSTRDWIVSQPMVLGRLLTNDLPTEIEEKLLAEGVPLFPRVEPLGKGKDGKPIWDVKMSCSCPDWMRPCKHLVAVLLLLGEEIAHHPSTLLALRGIDVDELVPPEKVARIEDEDSTFAPPVANLSLSDATRFRGVVDNAAPLLRRLGPIPFWRGTGRCLEALTQIYKRVQPVARSAADGKSIDLRS